MATAPAARWKRNAYAMPAASHKNVEKVEKERIDPSAMELY